VEKTPLGPAPEQPGGGRIKQKIIAKKKAEMKDYMVDVKGLLGIYVPPDPQRIQEAYQAGKVSLNPKGGFLDLVFRDYVKPGDQMTLSYDTTSRKVTLLTINTYMDQPKDTVTLRVQMSSLPDGTNHVDQTFLNATEKKLMVTTTNSNYQKLGA
jgi:hypothetical protein